MEKIIKSALAEISSYETISIHTPEALTNEDHAKYRVCLVIYELARHLDGNLDKTVELDEITQSFSGEKVAVFPNMETPISELILPLLIGGKVDLRHFLRSLLLSENIPIKSNVPRTATIYNYLNGKTAMQTDKLEMFMQLVADKHQKK